MPEYLTKEEIKEWRSSLEKITLEEFAARRGKVLEEQKQTNDLIDIVMKGQSVVSKVESTDSSEKLATVKAVEPVKVKPSVKKDEVKSPDVSVTPVNVEVKEDTAKVVEKKVEKVKKAIDVPKIDYSNIEFEKPLTEREQKVFEMFYKNAGQIVYAKDLADLLELPRDYVYKYIKTLRAKIKGDKLENADKGGYVLKL